MAQRRLRQHRIVWRAGEFDVDQRLALGEVHLRDRLRAVGRLPGGDDALPVADVSGLRFAVDLRGKVSLGTDSRLLTAPAGLSSTKIANRMVWFCPGLVIVWPFPATHWDLTVGSLAVKLGSISDASQQQSACSRLPQPARLAGALVVLRCGRRQGGCCRQGLDGASTMPSDPLSSRPQSRPLPCHHPAMPCRSNRQSRPAQFSLGVLPMQHRIICHARTQCATPSGGAS